MNKMIKLSFHFIYEGIDRHGDAGRIFPHNNYTFDIREQVNIVFNYYFVSKIKC